ncbi:MAG TPA: hypothetical protein QF423_03690 [Candidatus Scalindua sp.]|nr:hypothetical protein [Candidatus Scalindua sp.]
MQPDYFTLREAKEGIRRSDAEGGLDEIDIIVATLAKGDITRREEILWGYTPEECEPYIEYCTREVTLQRATLADLGIKEDSPQSCKRSKRKRKLAVGEYCGGRDLEECKGYFGEAVLPRICETCPD